jgi:hypothetical protein
VDEVRKEHGDEDDGDDEVDHGVTSCFAVFLKSNLRANGEEPVAWPRNKPE